MNRDEIIAMAHEAGTTFVTEHGVASATPEWLARFAALVAAAEREACAKVVEPDSEHRRDASWGYLGGEEGVELLDCVAAAIRARSET